MLGISLSSILSYPILFHLECQLNPTPAFISTTPIFPRSNNLKTSIQLIPIQPPKPSTHPLSRSTAQPLPPPLKMSTFNILGSAKLNTPDGKNPPTTSTSEATATGASSLSSSGSSDSSDSSGSGSGSGSNAGGGDEAASGARTKTACQAAHDELEARLRDEELGHRSKGW